MAANGGRPGSGWARAAFYLLFFTLAFHRFWFGTIIFRDSLLFFAPYKSLIAEALRRGSLNLWNPWMLLGLPLAGEFQAGLWYPFNLLFAAFPFGAAHRLFILAHYPIAAWNFDLFLRRRGLSSRAAVWGALVFSCSGYLISQHAPVRMVLGAAWAPLALYCFDRAGTEKFFAAAAGAALALMMLATDPETATTAAAVGTVMVLGRTAREGRWAAGVSAVGLAAVAALACAAVQIIPAVEMLRLTDRGAGLSLDDARMFSLLPGQLLEFVWPSPYGSIWPDFTFWGHFLVERASDRNLPWSLTNYLGLPALALIAYGVAAARPRWKRAALAAAVIFLALSLGKTLPFYGWLHHLPIFSAVRYPSKYVGWLIGSLAALSALGLDAMMERMERPGAWRLAAVYAAVAAVIAGLMAAVWPGVIGREATYLEIENFSATAVVEFWELFRQWAGINAGVAVGLLLLASGRARRPALAALLLLAALDWGLFSISTMPVGPAALYDFSPFTAQAMVKDGGPSAGRYRLFQFTFNFRDGEPRLPFPKVTRQGVWMRQALVPNLHVLPRLESMGGYTSYQFLGDGNLLCMGARRWLMEMYNVRYVVGQGTEAVQDGTTLLKEDVEGIRIVRLDHPWPRAYFVARPLPARDSKAAQALMADAWRGRTAVIEGATPSAAGPAAGDTAGLVPAEVTSYEPDRVDVRVSAPGPGWLVLSDRDFPGWTARVDGREARIYRANVMVRAVRVGPGDHAVEFRYRPRSVFWGALISGPAWLLFFGMWAARFRKKWKKA